MILGPLAAPLPLHKPEELSDTWAMPLDSIDLSAEQTPVLDREIDDGRAWIAADLSPNDWTVSLDGAALAELDRLVAAIEAVRLPLLLRHPDDFELPTIVEVMAEVRRRLDHGCGFAVIDSLPLDRQAPAAMLTCFWLLGQMIGRTVAQKWDGTMIYDVTDTGQEYGYGVRGSATNVELVFHNDNAFGLALPEYVGLFCERPALEGGTSRFCSLYTVHNRMRARHPDLLARLYHPMLFDRQAEHAPEAARTSLAPFFAWDGARLSGRVNVSLVRKGYEVAGRALDAELADALDAVETVANAPELWVEAPLKRGELQYLNNREIAHYRSGFVDHPDPARKRHLYRTWHRDRGRRSYDG